MLRSKASPGCLTKHDSEKERKERKNIQSNLNKANAKMHSNVSICYKKVIQSYKMYLFFQFLDVISLITTMLNKDPRRRATLEDILNHQWLKDSNTKLDWEKTVPYDNHVTTTAITVKKNHCIIVNWIINFGIIFFTQRTRRRDWKNVNTIYNFLKQDTHSLACLPFVQ